MENETKENLEEQGCVQTVLSTNCAQRLNLIYLKSLVVPSISPNLKGGLCILSNNKFHLLLYHISNDNVQLQILRLNYQIIKNPTKALSIGLFFLF